MPITDGTAKYVIHKFKALTFIAGIYEPDDVITCKGGGVEFSCELNTINANISNNDVQWYRSIKDTGAVEKITMNSSITVITNTSGNVLTTTLTIFDAERSYTGYYWVESPSDDICNVSVTVGTSM